MAGDLVDLRCERIDWNRRTADGDLATDSSGERSGCWTLYRIEARHFVAGLEVGRPRHRCAPIVRYMADWTPDAIVTYCRRKGWKITRLDPS